MFCIGNLLNKNGWIYQFVHNCSFANSDIRKVRKRQSEYPEFGHTQGEIQKKSAKKYISIQGGVKLRKPSILMVFLVSRCLSFFLSPSSAAT